MKVKMVVSIAGHAMPEYGLEGFAFLPEQVLELADELAVKWIAGGHAVPYEDPPPIPPQVDPESATMAAGENTMIDHRPARKPRG